MKPNQYPFFPLYIVNSFAYCTVNVLESLGTKCMNWYANMQVQERIKTSFPITITAAAQENKIYRGES
jgi:hypothetical protein